MPSLRKFLILAALTAGLVAVLPFSGHIWAASAAAGAAERADLYIATNGNDKWSGKLDAPNAQQSDGPFASLERAQKAVREFKKNQKDAPVVVMLRQGTYFLGQTLQFDSNDSGTSKSRIIYEAYPGEKPTISGGRPISGWKVSGNRWTVTLNSRDYQNFENLFVNDERRYRPRTTPDGYLYVRGPVTTSERSSGCSVHPGEGPGGGGGRRQGQGGNRQGPYGGRRQGGYGWPGGPGGGGQGPRGGGRQRPEGGESGGSGYLCFDRFYYKGDDVAATYHGIGLGDVEVLVFEKWTMSRLRLSSVDTSTHIAYLTGGTFPAPQVSGIMADHRYIVENVLEALKQPGQWYLDRCPSNGNCTSPEAEWTLTYLAKPGEDPNKAQVIVPQLSQLLVARDLQYVTFKGLTLSHDNWMPGPEGLGDFQGGTKATGALGFTNSSHITFDSDVVRNIQGWGIDIISEGGPSTGNEIVNSALYDAGYGAIRIGRRAAREDNDDNVPQYNRIENNIISGGGRVIPSGIGTGVWIGNSHHNIVSHNEIYDYYNGAIRIGFKLNISDGIGNAHDNLVSYNLAYDLGQGVTSDMAGIYLSNSAATGNQVLNNVVHDVVHDPGTGGYGGEGLYFDQGASNIVAKNNLVYRVSQAGLFVNLAERFDGETPQNNLVTNNIFAYSRRWVLQRGGENQSTFTFTHNIVLYDKGPIQAFPGKWSCFGDCPRRFLMDYNLYWHAKGDKPEFITTDPDRHQAEHYDLGGWKKLGEDVHSIVADPQFVAPHPPQDDFTLKPGSPAKDIGFVPFNPKEAGCTHPLMRPPPLPPAFPRQVPDPNDF